MMIGITPSGSPRAGTVASIKSEPYPNFVLELKTEFGYIQFIRRRQQPDKESKKQNVYHCSEACQDSAH